MDTSSTDESSLEFSDYSTASETSTTAGSASIHSKHVPELQDIGENNDKDSMVITVDNIEAVLERESKGCAGTCHYWYTQVR